MAAKWVLMHQVLQEKRHPRKLSEMKNGYYSSSEFCLMSWDLTSVPSERRVVVLEIRYLSESKDGKYHEHG
ncbi:hypothetical protein QG37_07310 [Candidozyma auris]|nr:hypothetical protein QG37_07310 [[Candida] auris]